MERRDVWRHGVTLACGSALYYEAATFVPEIDELVPCVRHGYCAVVAARAHRRGGATNGSRRAPRRTQEQFLAYLQRNPAPTLSQLRRERFTLRIVQDSVRSGAVVVDDDSDGMRVRTREA